MLVLMLLLLFYWVVNWPYKKVGFGALKVSFLSNFLEVWSLK